MVITCRSRKHKRCNRHTSLYDLGYFDFEKRDDVTKLLEPLGVSRNRPLVWPGNAVVLEVRLSGAVSADAINNYAVQLAAQRPSLSDESNIFCGWK